MTAYSYYLCTFYSRNQAFHGLVFVFGIKKEPSHQF